MIDLSPIRGAKKGGTVKTLLKKIKEMIDMAFGSSRLSPKPVPVPVRNRPVVQRRR